MGIKLKPILFKFDFIGLTPQIRILNESSYKSIFSSILSILLILFSLIFIAFSFSEYIKQKPKVDYYKNNDFITNKTFLISDSLLMFKYSFHCTNDPLINNTLSIKSVDQYNLLQSNFEFETCELGKNINIKYREVIEKFEKTQNQKISDYYCINYKNTNLTLYNDPSMPRDIENYLNLEIIADCQKFDLNFTLVTQNDFIDHENRYNPIIPYYQVNNMHLENSSNLYLVYDYQFIKYESENGVIFSKINNTNGVGFSGSNPFDQIEVGDKKFTIDFRINPDNYDFYRRSFEKFQSFLADVMSLINLLITISKVVSDFLLNKKMNKDIIRNILTIKEEKENNSELKNTFNKEKAIHQMFESENNKKENNILETEGSKNTFKEQNSKGMTEDENIDKKITKVMKNLNVFNIIKSFFSNKDKKLKLINLCDSVVNMDLCIERILKRIFILENNFNLLIEENKINSYPNSEITQIKEIISQIDMESNDKKENKEEITLTEKNEIK